MSLPPFLFPAQTHMAPSKYTYGGATYGLLMPGCDGPVGASALGHDKLPAGVPLPASTNLGAMSGMAFDWITGRPAEEEEEEIGASQESSFRIASQQSWYGASQATVLLGSQATQLDAPMYTTATGHGAHASTKSFSSLHDAGWKAQHPITLKETMSFAPYDRGQAFVDTIKSKRLRAPTYPKLFKRHGRDRGMRKIFHEQFCYFQAGHLETHIDPELLSPLIEEEIQSSLAQEKYDPFAANSLLLFPQTSMVVENETRENDHNVVVYYPDGPNGNILHETVLPGPKATTNDFLTKHLERRAISTSLAPILELDTNHAYTTDMRDTRLAIRSMQQIIFHALPHQSSRMHDDALHLYATDPDLGSMTSVMFNPYLPHEAFALSSTGHLYRYNGDQRFISCGARGEKPDASATGIAMEWRGMCMAAHPREIFVASPHGLYLEDLRAPTERRCLMLLSKAEYGFEEHERLFALGDTRRISSSGHASSTPLFKPFQCIASSSNYLFAFDYRYPRAPVWRQPHYLKHEPPQRLTFLASPNDTNGAIILASNRRSGSIHACQVGCADVPKSMASSRLLSSHETSKRDTAQPLSYPPSVLSYRDLSANPSPLELYHMGSREREVIHYGHPLIGVAPHLRRVLEEEDRGDGEEWVLDVYQMFQYQSLYRQSFSLRPRPPSPSTLQVSPSQKDPGRKTVYETAAMYFDDPKLSTRITARQSMTFLPLLKFIFMTYDCPDHEGNVEVEWTTIVEPMQQFLSSWKSISDVYTVMKPILASSNARHDPVQLLRAMKGTYHSNIHLRWQPMRWFGKLLLQKGKEDDTWHHLFCSYHPQSDHVPVNSNGDVPADPEPSSPTKDRDRSLVKLSADIIDTDEEDALEAEHLMSKRRARMRKVRRVPKKTDVSGLQANYATLSAAERLEFEAKLAMALEALLTRVPATTTAESQPSNDRTSRQSMATSTRPSVYHVTDDMIANEVKAFPDVQVPHLPATLTIDHPLAAKCTALKHIAYDLDIEKYVMCQRPSDSITMGTLAMPVMDIDSLTAKIKGKIRASQQSLKRNARLRQGTATSSASSTPPVVTSFVAEKAHFGRVGRYLDTQWNHADIPTVRSFLRDGNATRRSHKLQKQRQPAPPHPFIRQPSQEQTGSVVTGPPASIPSSPHIPVVSRSSVAFSMSQPVAMTQASSPASPTQPPRARARPIPLSQPTPSVMRPPGATKKTKRRRKGF